MECNLIVDQSLANCPACDEKNGLIWPYLMLLFFDLNGAG
jgi:hypothetical protein